MPEKCVPDETFVERLEWQLGSEYRRAALRRSAGGRIAIPRTLAAAALLVGILLTGVTVIKASEIIKESWRKKIEIARVETDIRLSRALSDAARSSAAQVERRFALGLVQEEEVLAAKDFIRKAEWSLERSFLNKAEVETSGEAPSSEIDAPVVRGRDFVAEQLALDIRQAEMDGAALERRQARLGRLFDVGLVGQEDLGMARAESTAAKAAVDGLRRRLELRKRFVDGGISAERVEIEDRLGTAAQNLTIAQAKAVGLKDRLARLEVLFSVGTVSASEVQELRMAMEAAQAERRLAALELDVLGKIK